MSALAETPARGSVRSNSNLPSNTVLATVTVGTKPSAIVVSPDSSTVYVANSNSNSVSVIDATKSTYPVKATIAAGSSPEFLAITPDGQTLYVSNAITAGTVSVVSTTSYMVSTTIAIGANLQDLAVTPDGKELYVTYGQNNQGAIAIVDTGTNQVTATLACGGSPYLIVFTRDGRRADELNEAGSGFVQFVSTISQKLLTASWAAGVSFYPTGMVTGENGKRLFITDQRNFVFAHIGQLDRVMSAVPSVFSAELLGQPALSLNERYLYIPYSFDYNTNQADHQVAVLDVSDGQLVGSVIQVGNYPSWATIAPNGGTLYVSNANDGTVSVIDIAQ